jgi:uridine kinase
MRLSAELDLLVVPAGTVIVREGDDDRDLFFVGAGEAVERHRGAERGRIAAGDCFGAFELVAGTPHPSTITALTEVVLQRLPHARFERIERDDPALALALVQRILALVSSPHHPGARTRSNTIGEVDVTIDGKVMRVAAGTPLLRLLPSEVDGEPVVAGLVDRRAMSLVTPILAGGVLQPLTTAHWEGSRVYRRSVGLLLLEAVARFRPDLQAQLGYSLGYAQRVHVRGEVTSWATLAEEVNAWMLRLVDEDLALREVWWTIDEARASFERAGWHSAAELLRTSRDTMARAVTFGTVHALRIDAIAPRTGMLTGFCVIAGSDGLVLVHGDVDDLGAAPRGRTVVTPAPAHTQAAVSIARRTETMMRDHVRWLETMGVTDVGGLNSACIGGDVSQLIRVAEGFHEKRVGQIADAIAARTGRVKVVAIAGPSSSGKSTFIKRLRVQLLVNKIHPRDISLDDYFIDRAAVRPGPNGEIDLEALEILHIDLLQEHLSRLLAGETVATARYDFRTGKSHPAGGPTLCLAAGDVLLVEGIHGLNPRLLATLAETEVFRVFVSPLAQLPFDHLSRVHASDLRLIRRIVRDRHFRSTNAAATIAQWPSVRDGERRHIFAYQHHADEVFDSSLVYELSVLRVFAERYLLEVPADRPEYTTAFRLLRMLDQFVTIYPDHVPPTSILREFLGGSGFEY